MGRLVLCCLAAALLVSCGSDNTRSRTEAVRLCRFAAQGRLVYTAVVGMANTAVTRTSDSLGGIESDDGAEAARRCERLTHSLEEPIAAVKGFRQALENLDLQNAKNRAARAGVSAQLRALERDLRDIHAGVEAIERTAEAHPKDALGAVPAIPQLQARLKAFRPGGDALSPLIEQLRREHSISDSELRIIRRRLPSRRYALA